MEDVSSIPDLAILIHTLRGRRVTLDPDLSVLYGVETRALNQGVMRHPERLPPDFTFELTPDESRNIARSMTCSDIKHSKRVAARAFLTQNRRILRQLVALEHRVSTQGTGIGSLIDAVRGSLTETEAPRKRIGFRAAE